MSEETQKTNTKHQKRNLELLIVPLVCLVIMFTIVLFPQTISNQSENRTKEISNSEMELTLAADPGTENETESESESDLSPDAVTIPPSDDSWMLVLVNKDHPLPADYEITLTTLSNGQTVDSRIYPALQEMFDDMRAQGYYPMVRSGYRSYQDQEKLVNNRIEEYMYEGMSEEEAKEKTYSEAALPGTSEHQLGLGVDINPNRDVQNNDKVYTWLAAHAHEYGFIKRFPEDKTDITGIVNEPWHYRYVGKEAAAEMHESGECLEEYLAK